MNSSVRVLTLISISFLASAQMPSTAPSPTYSASTVYKGFEYAIIDDLKYWLDHEKAAVAWGGHLASVNSKEEYDFILAQLQLITGCVTLTLCLGLSPVGYVGYFLGGMRISGQNTDSGKETWAWSDGSPWDYTAWWGGQPDNFAGIEDRVHIFGNLWNDASLSVRRAIYKRSIPIISLPECQTPILSQTCL